MSYQRRQSKLAAAAAAKEALRTEKKFQNAEKKLQNQAEEALATENKLQNASKQKGLRHTRKTIITIIAYVSY